MKKYTKEEFINELVYRTVLQFIEEQNLRPYTESEKTIIATRAADRLLKANPNSLPTAQSILTTVKMEYGLFYATNWPRLKYPKMSELLDDVQGYVRPLLDNDEYTYSAARGSQGKYAYKCSICEHTRFGRYIKVITRKETPTFHTGRTLYICRVCSPSLF